MNIVEFDRQPLKTRGINHRQGSFKYVELGEGLPGSAQNFNLRWVLSEPDFFSPRHRHNFDQARVQLRGEFSFDDDGRMTVGTAGFFPEGTFYGPQTSREDTVQLVMQIGGASGNGYLSERERIAAVEALARRGQFRSGHYYPEGSGESGKVDGFQAAWEYARGQAMEYPAQRFARPLICNPSAMNWLVDDHREGIAHKTLWDFGSDTVGLRLLKLAPGATITLSGPISLFVLRGRAGLASAESPCANIDAQDVLHLERAELAQCSAHLSSEFIVFVHPVLKAGAS